MQSIPRTKGGRPSRAFSVSRPRAIAAIAIAAIAVAAAGASCASIPPMPDFPGSGVTRDEAIAYVRAVISSEAAARGITGLSISVADSSGLVWSDGYGLADKAGKRAFAPDTISNVGSVSKLVTGAAVMKLVETGKIDLDAPLTRYVPEFSPKTLGPKPDGVTIRSLLCHESGLESDAVNGFMYGLEKPSDFPNSYRRAVDAANECYLVREPWTAFSYCNLGYALLGVAVERASGQGFHEYVRDAIFAPLGMDDSRFDLDPADAGRTALGYAPDGETEIPYIRDMPAGSLRSTADDMAKFSQAMLASWRGDGGFFPKSLAREAFARQNASVEFDSDFSIGLSWWIVDFESLPGELALGHGGDLPPFHALLVALPERDLAVFVMVNSVGGLGSFGLTDIASEALRAFAASDRGVVIPSAPSSPAPETNDPAALDELVGNYATPMGLMSVSRSGTRLSISGFGAPLEGVLHQDGRISLEARVLGIKIDVAELKELSASVERTRYGVGLGLRMRGILAGGIGIRIAPSPVPEAWKKREGEWTAADLEGKAIFDAIKLGVDSATGIFCLSMFSGGRWLAYPIEFVSDGMARLAGQGRSLGGIVWASVEGGVERLTFTNLSFERKK
jgi:CubicO group peptidase (beta-lactamase class C family)